MKLKINEITSNLKVSILSSFSANVINRIVSMLSLMVITRLLSQVEYGIWSYALNIYSYLLLITGFGLLTGALQFGTECNGRERAYGYFKYCTEKGEVINFSLIIAFAIVFFFTRISIEEAKIFIITILPFLLLEYIISMGETILITQNRITQYANILNINTFFIAVGTCGGAIFGLKGVIIGRYFACLFTIFYLFIIIKKDILCIFKADNLKKSEKKKLWHYSVFVGTSSALNCLVYYLDITLIASLLKNATEVGIYKVGTLIPNALQFIPNCIVIAILPNIIYKRKDIFNLKRTLKKTYLALFTLNSVIVFVLVFASPTVIKILSGDKYIDSVPVLKVLLIGYFFSGTFRGLSVNLLAAFHKVHFGLFISLVSCFLDIVLTYWFIKVYGMIGAAYATLLVDFITAMISFGYFILLIKKGTINHEVS